MTFLPDLPEDEPDVIEMCDVELHGTCDHCDHPCLAYFKHKAWWVDCDSYDDDDWLEDYDYTEGDVGQDGEI